MSFIGELTHAVIRMGVILCAAQASGIRLAWFMTLLGHTLCPW